MCIRVRVRADLSLSRGMLLRSVGSVYGSLGVQSGMLYETQSPHGEAPAHPIKASGSCGARARKCTTR